MVLLYLLMGVSNVKNLRMCLKSLDMVIAENGQRNDFDFMMP